MTVAYIADHIAQAQGRLITQYQGQANIEALVAGLASRTQVLEDALQTIAKGRFLFGDAASGAQLDAIGALIGIARNGLEDSVYRILIRGKIATNTSRGTLADIVTITAALFQASAVYVTTPNAPGHARQQAYAEISLAVADPKTDLALLPLLLRIIRASLPAGVVLVSLSAFESTDAQALACEGPQPWVGFLSAGPDDPGGLLADILFQQTFA